MFFAHSEFTSVHWNATKTFRKISKIGKLVNFKKTWQTPRTIPKENILIQIHACKDNFEERQSTFIDAGDWNVSRACIGVRLSPRLQFSWWMPWLLPLADSDCTNKHTCIKTLIRLEAKVNLIGFLICDRLIPVIPSSRLNSFLWSGLTWTLLGWTWLVAVYLPFWTENHSMGRKRDKDWVTGRLFYGPVHGMQVCPLI